MKRILPLLLSVLLAVAPALPALAVTGGGSIAPATRESAHPSADAYIVAATATDTAGGELTSIAPGQSFNMVLLVADYAAAVYNVRPEEISARVNSSIFTYSGTAQVMNSGDDQNAFEKVTNADGQVEFYRYVLYFPGVVYNGGGNTFTVDLSYLNSGSNSDTFTIPMQQLSYNVGQCTEPSATPDTDEGSTRVPNLMVRNSSYGNALINAGTPFTLAVTVYATKGAEDLDDVTVTLDLRSEGISLQTGTLSQYIGAMKANSTQEVYFTILPSVSFTGGVADIGVTLQGYGSKSGDPSSGSVSISVPIAQPDRFEVSGVEISDTIYVGEGGSITISFINKGHNPISNLEARIDGTNLGAEISRQYIGNVAAGSENSLDFDLYPDSEGPMTGTVTLEYEGSDGTKKVLTEDFSSNAVSMNSGMDMMPTEPMPDESDVEPAGGMPLWGWALLGAGVVAGGGAAVALVRKRRKAKALARLEADDEDL